MKRMAAYQRKRERLFDLGTLSFRERSTEAADAAAPAAFTHRETRKIANLAAIAARAARMWRMSQRQCAVKALLPEGRQR